MEYEVGQRSGKGAYDICNAAFTDGCHPPVIRKGESVELVDKETGETLFKQVNGETVVDTGRI